MDNNEHFIREIRNYLKDLIAKKERLELSDGNIRVRYGRLEELKDIIIKLETIFIESDIRI